MVTILPALRQVREDLVKILDRSTVERLCDDIGHRWRNRQLDPWTTLHLFILQVVNCNTAMTHLPHLSDERFTAPAYCRARRRLPLRLLERLVEQFGGQLDRPGEDPLWHGHRVVLIDGSAFSMPDTPELQARFGQSGAQKPGCGFPVAHVLAVVDAHRGFLRQVIISPLRTHDMAHVAEAHPQLRSNDVLVGDRGFCSYVHLALISGAKRHAVFRIHQRQLVDFRPHRPSAQERPGRGRPTSRWVRRLGKWDQLVEWRRPITRPKWMTSEQFAALPETLLVRELKYCIREKGCRVQEVILVTTLLDAERYPASEIAALYGLRWRVEVDLRDLKITLGLDVLKGHSVDVVMKEVQVYALVYNLVRLVMLKAAERQKVSPDRISFIDALRWLQLSKPDQTLPQLVVNPRRPGRVEPRCVKRRRKAYSLMTRPRQELRKRLKKRRNAA